MSATGKLKRGSRVLVPWGLDEPREATVIDVWGDPGFPTQIRVELDTFEAGEESTVLLLNPATVTPAA